jgi:hypothetical protein
MTAAGRDSVTGVILPPARARVPKWSERMG